MPCQHAPFRQLSCEIRPPEGACALSNLLQASTKHLEGRGTARRADIRREGPTRRPPLLSTRPLSKGLAVTKCVRSIRWRCIPSTLPIPLLGVGFHSFLLGVVPASLRGQTSRKRLATVAEAATGQPSLEGPEGQAAKCRARVRHLKLSRCAREVIAVAPVPSGQPPYVCPASNRAGARGDVRPVLPTGRRVLSSLAFGLQSMSGF